MTATALPTVYEVLNSASLMQLGLVDLLFKSTAILLLGFSVISLFKITFASSRSTVWTMAFSCLLFLPLLHALVPEFRIAFSFLDSSVAVSKGFSLFERLGAYSKWIITLYTVVALGLCLYLLVGIARAFALLRNARPLDDSASHEILSRLKASNGISQQIQLLVSEDVSSPVTMGVIKHKIIVPPTALDWSPELLKQVLSHELGHIVRGDWVQHIASRLVACIYWFNPLLWLAQRNLLMESEKACDDMAVDDSECNITYAENLLWLAGSLPKRQGSCAPALLGHRCSLSERIENILHSERSVQHIDRNGYTPSVLIALCFSALLASLSIHTNSAETIRLEYSPIPVQFFSRGSLESESFAIELENLRTQIKP